MCEKRSSLVAAHIEIKKESASRRDQSGIAFSGENQTQHISDKHLMPAVKHRGGGLIIWVCFTAT